MSCAASSIELRFAAARRRTEAAREVVGFWGDAGRGRWFRKDAAFDALIARRFAHAADAALDHQARFLNRA